MPVGEGTEPWETVEAGVDVVMFHLGAARTIAQLGGIYCSNAESKLQGKKPRVGPGLKKIFSVLYQS